MQCELVWQETKSDCCIIQLTTQAVQRVFQYLCMIKCEGRQIIHRKPPNVYCIISSSDLQTFRIEQSKIDNCNNTSSGITPGIAKSIKLLKVYILHTGFFLKFTFGCILQGF